MMMATIGCMPTLHVGRGTTAGGVTVFPVWTDAAGVRGLDTGRTARVEVAERAGSAVVGELVLTNHGPRPVLLLEGELLEGGRQHRTLVTDVILEPGIPQVVPVACVERGRWSGTDAHARRGRRAPATVRAALCSPVAQVRQHHVWQRIQDQQRPAMHSATESLLDHLDGAGAPVVPPVLAGQRGVIVGVGSHPLTLDLFGSPRALAAHLPALLTAALLDDLAVPAQHRGPVPGWRVREMARHLDGTRLQPGTPAAGAGITLRAATSRAVVRGIATEAGTLAHLSVLNTSHPMLGSM
jgi:hypothetical protein